MALTPERQKKILIVTTAVLALLVAYRVVTAEKPKTAPLVYTRGAVASSKVRPGLASRAAWADPLNVLLTRREEKFPGVARDIFRMQNPAPKPRFVAPPPPPPVHVKTPEEIAAEAAQSAAQTARADLSKFRFLGYLTDKDNTLFLSKDGELFVVKSGDQVLKNYKVKEAGKDYVILLDTVTRVEVRIFLSGGEPSFQQSPPQQPQQFEQPAPQPQQQRPPIFRKPPASG
jgi:hypothetical protein